MKQMAKGKVKEREKRKENKIPCLTAAANVLKHDVPFPLEREREKKEKKRKNRERERQ